MLRSVLIEIDRLNKLIACNRNKFLTTIKELQRNPVDPLLRASLKDLRRQSKELKVFREELWFVYKKLLLVKKCS